MNATKILQQGRQPMIRFLGKRTTPSSQLAVAQIPMARFANAPAQRLTTHPKSTLRLPRTPFQSRSQAIARRPSSTVLSTRPPNSPQVTSAPPPELHLAPSSPPRAPFSTAPNFPSAFSA